MVLTYGLKLTTQVRESNLVVNHRHRIDCISISGESEIFPSDHLNSGCWSVCASFGIESSCSKAVFYSPDVKWTCKVLRCCCKKDGATDSLLLLLTV